MTQQQEVTIVVGTAAVLAFIVFPLLAYWFTNRKFNRTYPETLHNDKVANARRSGLKAALINIYWCSVPAILGVLAYIAFSILWPSD